jgi:hypothetical protein
MHAEAGGFDVVRLRQGLSGPIPSNTAISPGPATNLSICNQDLLHGLTLPRNVSRLEAGDDVIDCRAEHGVAPVSVGITIVLLAQNQTGADTQQRAATQERADRRRHAARWGFLDVLERCFDWARTTRVRAGAGRNAHAALALR